MKIAINLTREKVGGITSSNINLINYLYKSNYEFTGIELVSRMHMEGPALFRSFAPEIFDHHIMDKPEQPALEEGISIGWIILAVVLVIAVIAIVWFIIKSRREK